MDNKHWQYQFQLCHNVAAALSVPDHKIAVQRKQNPDSEPSM